MKFKVDNQIELEAENILNARKMVESINIYLRNFCNGKLILKDTLFGEGELS